MLQMAQAHFMINLQLVDIPPAQSGGYIFLFACLNLPFQIGLRIPLLTARHAGFFCLFLEQHVVYFAVGRLERVQLLCGGAGYGLRSGGGGAGSGGLEE